MNDRELYLRARDNGLLAAMREDHREGLLHRMQITMLTTGQTLYKAGEVVQVIYFPIGAVVALVHEMANGGVSEVALVGSEGMIGVHRLLGNDASAQSVMVQVGGPALRIAAVLLEDCCQRVKPLEELMLGYADALLRHISWTAACNRLHSVEQRLCKWILLCSDRTWGRELVMTQELIATMLGDRRETITVVERRLQAAGLIRCSRGRLQVLDRRALEARACECYSNMRGQTRKHFWSWIPG